VLNSGRKHSALCIEAPTEKLAKEPNRGTAFFRDAAASADGQLHGVERPVVDLLDRATTVPTE
jgi:hypothetical protein